MTPVSNIIEFRKTIRVTNPDGTVGEVPYPEKGCGDAGPAKMIVERSVKTAEMMDALNNLSASLSQLRKRADAGDIGAQYDANIQISLISSLMDCIADYGDRPRYVSKTGRFEIF